MGIGHQRGRKNPLRETKIILFVILLKDSDIVMQKMDGQTKKGGGTFKTKFSEWVKEWI